MKRTICLLLMGLLLVSLSGCKDLKDVTSDGVTNNSSDIYVETSSNPPKDSNKEVSNEPSKLSQVDKEFTLILYDTEIKLPMSYADFAKINNVQLDVPSDVEIHHLEFFRILGKMGDEDITITVTAPTTTNCIINDSQVVEIECDARNIKLPNNITNQSSVEQIIEAYGNPDVKINQLGYTSFYYNLPKNSFNDLDIVVKLQFENDTNLLKNISFGINESDE